MLIDGYSYDEFSNTLNQSRQEGDHNHTGSLEAVHNSMHGHLVCAIFFDVLRKLIRVERRAATVIWLVLTYIASGWFA